MTLRKEKGAIRKTWLHQLRVALVYPNSYSVGMSNLGFQHVYHALNSSDRFLAERFFYEPTVSPGSKKSPDLLSIESSRPLRDFHVIAFSVPFENDYLNIPIILRSGSIEPLARNRSSHDPVIMAGGVSVSMNPEPLARFMDLVYVGEIANVEAPDGLFRILADVVYESRFNADRDSLKYGLKGCPGVYIPEAYGFKRDEKGIIKTIEVDKGFPQKVAAVKTDWGFSDIPKSVIFSPETEFANTCLVEINRGCSRRCRFCAAGWIHSPVRYRGSDDVRRVITNAMETGLRLGLVGSDLAGHPELEKLVEMILDNRGAFSLSSIRPEGLSPFMIDALFRTGQKTATLAPETASQRLKGVIGKKIPSETFFGHIDRLVDVGIPNVRLYFMIGLPTESDDDVRDIVEFVLECRKFFVEASRKKKRIGALSVQVNPFIPKPWTPFQWAAASDKSSLERRIAILRTGLKNSGNISLRIEYGRDFFLQALLSRCDRDLGELLLNGPSGKKWSLTGLHKAGVNLDTHLYRERDQTEIFPWDTVDHGISRRILWKVYEESVKS